MKNYIIDSKGRKKAVILDVEEFSKLLEYIEDIEDALDLKKSVDLGGEFVELRDFMKKMRREGKL